MTVERDDASDLAEAISVLLSMFSQYCGVEETTSDGREMFDHVCMSAGEDASDVLFKHGLISLDQLIRP